MTNRILEVATGRGPVRKTATGLFLGALFTAVPAVSTANPDVYQALPVDTRVISHSLGDYDGDGKMELSVLYTSGGGLRLTLFDGDAGRWSKWRDMQGPLELKDGTAPRFLESADTTGDGRAEIFAYYLTGNNASMATRVFFLADIAGADTFLEIILEDTTSPPGYPLMGEENGKPSVTFMKMPTTGADGHRRVYCWTGDKFEKCKEVVWEKP